MAKALPTLLFLALAASCAGPEGSRSNALGGRHYGGIFNWNETGTVRSVHPPGLTTAIGYRIGALVYEGLVRLDPTDLSARPCLAERWDVDSSGTIYTFHLRQGVRFHTDSMFAGGEGRPFTASDVEHCFRRICTSARDNQVFWLFQDRVRGANAFHAETAAGRTPAAVEGIQVLDDRTVRIELTMPDPLFIQVLAHQGCWIYPAELEAASPQRRIRTIGTGPFVLRSQGSVGTLVFERNAAYWDRDEHGNTLPFLDGVRVTFTPDKSAELDAFEQGRLSLLVDPPVEEQASLSDTVDKTTGKLRFHVQRAAGLSVQYYGFNLREAPFDQLLVRRAFALAIDRQALVDSVLRGGAVVAGHGIVPPGLKDHPYDLIPPQRYDPELARSLLAEAGYPEGKGFPPIRLQVNNDGFGYVRVAEAVQAMIERNLGVGISISVLPADQHYDLVDAGRTAFWRQGWVADYPDPENFLAQFHGRNAVLVDSLRSPLNTTRFHDAVFDSLYWSARVTLNPTERSRSLALAEKRLMEMVPASPLYFERTVRLLQPWVKDMPMNAMELRDLARVWFDPALKPH